MKITAVVENLSKGELKARHGLSLYIQTQKHNILFDLGPDGTLFDNAEKLGTDLKNVDTVILSHGHMDHGGALEKFLEINKRATVYVQRKAFERHYYKALFFKLKVGIDGNLIHHPNIKVIDGDFSIDEELKLFTVGTEDKYYSIANDTLYGEKGKDDFSHEQNLMILEEANVLVMGCGHKGLLNILDSAKKYQPAYCIGGYHLYNPASIRTVSEKQLDSMARGLLNFDIKFYTCHCTGRKAFDYLAKQVRDMNYLSCGETIEIPSKFNIFTLRENPHLARQSAEWFSDKWGVPEEAYFDSIQESIKTGGGVPQWYIILDDKGSIIAGAGVIENDFHHRKDLEPNLCALYVEEAYRNKGIAKGILNFARKDMGVMGYEKLYLVTDHTTFYEKCGWEFLTMVNDDEGISERMYVSETKGLCY